MANKVTVVAELIDHITGPNKKLAREYQKSAADLEKANQDVAKATEKYALAQARSAAKGGQAMAVQAKDVAGSTSKIERALDDLSGTTQRTGKLWRQEWEQAEKSPKRVADELATQGRRMETDSAQIGRKVGDNLASGIQQGIDSIDVSDLTTLLGGATVAGGIAASLGRGTMASRIAASTGDVDAAAVRELTDEIYGAGWGRDYDAVSMAAGSVVATFDIEPGSPEAEKLLGGTATLDEIFGLGPDQLTMAARIIADNDEITGTAAQDILGAALQGATAAGRDELLDNLQEYVPLLNDTGISAAALATMLSGATGRGAMASDKTGDAIKEFSVRAIDTGSKPISEAYAELGLDQTDISRRLQSGDATAFTDVTQALAGIDDQAEQARLAIELFGTPIEDLGVGNIDDQINAWTNLDLSMSDAAGTITRMQDTLEDDPGRDWEIAMRDLSGAMVKVGDAVAPLVSAAATVISVLAEPLAVGATGLTLYGILQRIPGTTDLGKKSVKGLWGVLKRHPLGMAATAAWLLVEGMGALYDNVEFVHDAFDTVSDAIRDVVEWFDTLLGKADEWMGKKLGIENPGESTIVRDSVSHLATGGPSQAFYENNGLTTDPEAGWPDWLRDVEAWANRKTGIGDDKVHGEGWFRPLHGTKPDGPEFFTGGYTGNVPTTAVAGSVHGQEFVTNAWATRRLEASNPGGLATANATGRWPSAGGVTMGGDTVVFNIYDQRDPNAVVAVVRDELTRRDRTKRLTYATPTVRGAR